MIKSPKILLVSDIYQHSTMDVYNGYVRALSDFGIPFDTFNMVRARESFSGSVTGSILLSRILTITEGITHVLYVAGTAIPQAIVETVHAHGIWQGVIATDDPHSSGKIKRLCPYIDCWYTNERTIADTHDKSVYLPTAAPVSFPSMRERKIDYEIVFVGSIYPNRIPIFNRLSVLARKHNLRCTWRGHIQLVPPNQPLWQFATQGRVENAEALLLYQRSKIVINCERDINWHPTGHNPNLVWTGHAPYDSNPRVHEIAIVRGNAVHINPRQSVIDQYGDAVWTCDDENLETEVLSALNSPYKLATMADAAYDICCSGHTYTHRALSLLKNMGYPVVVSGGNEQTVYPEGDSDGGTNH